MPAPRDGRIINQDTDTFTVNDPDAPEDSPKMITVPKHQGPIDALAEGAMYSDKQGALLQSVRKGNGFRTFNNNDY